jgi:sulfate permease, SulP family
MGAPRFGALLFGSLRGYRRGWLRADLVAGLAVWAVLVPESLAYAVLAGVPPVVGLWAAPAALVLYAALGSSRHLVVGPMSASAALSGVVVGGLTADAGRVAALTAGVALVTGLISIGAGLLRLGFLAGFVSQPVLKGFIIGLALTIVAGQLPKLFGLERVDGVFFEKLWGLSTELGKTNGWAVVIGVGSLVLLLLLRRFVPLVPAAMVTVLAGVLASVLLDLPTRGVAVVGSIASGLPPFGLPELRLADYASVVAGAVGIALVGFAEGLAAAQTYAAKAGYDIDADRELVGVGVANLGAGLCAGMVVSGSLSKTAVNGGAGARSQASGLIVAALTAVTLQLLTGLFEQLPEATLGAIVIVAVAELIDFPALRRLYRIWTSQLGAIYGPAARVDFLAALAALFGVLLFDTPARAVHRHRRLGPVVGLPSIATERRRARPNRRPRSSLGRPRPPPGGRAGAGCHGRARGGRPVLRERRLRTRQDPPNRGVGECARRRSRRRDHPVDRPDRRADARRSRGQPGRARHPPTHGSRRRSGPRRAAAGRGVGDRGGRAPDCGRRGAGRMRPPGRDLGHRPPSITHW